MQDILLKPVRAADLQAKDFYADLKAGKIRKIQAISMVNDKVTLDFAKGSPVSLKSTQFVCILHAIRKG